MLTGSMDVRGVKYHGNSQSVAGAWTARTLVFALNSLHDCHRLSSFEDVCTMHGRWTVLG